MEEYRKLISEQFREDFLESNIKEFISEYERELIELVYTNTNTILKQGIYKEKEEEEEDESEFLEYIESAEYEIIVLEKAFEYFIKSHFVAYDLLLTDSRRIDTLKSKKIRQNNQRKMYFVGRKLKQLGINVDLTKIVNGKPIIKKNNLLIGGKKPNYSERYKIANDTLGLFTNINNRNISQTEKHILLAHILGCSQQVARELFNGTQQKRTPVREDMINKYLDTLN